MAGKKRTDNKGRVLRNGEMQRSEDNKYLYRYVDMSGKKKQCILCAKLFYQLFINCLYIFSTHLLLIHCKIYLYLSRFINGLKSMLSRL